MYHYFKLFVVSCKKFKIHYAEILFLCVALSFICLQSVSVHVIGARADIINLTAACQ